MSFFTIWLNGYFRPRRAFGLLRNAPAPLYGIYSIALRSACIALLWMLPRALMRLEPASVPGFPFLSPENYYRHAVWIYPVFEFSRWLLFSAFIHVILRLFRKPTNFDSILNIAGMGSLIVEPAVRLWDWLVFALGWNGNLMFLGLSHAVIAWPWSLVLVAVAYKEILGLRPRWSVPLALVSTLLFIPLAAVFLRP